MTTTDENQPDPDYREYLTRTEIARRVGCSRRSVDAMLAGADVPMILVSASHRFHWPSVRAMIEMRDE